jgi:hypothetical protein
MYSFQTTSSLRLPVCLLYLAHQVPACNLPLPMWSSVNRRPCQLPGGVGQQTKFMAAQLGYNIIGEGCCTPSAHAREYCSFYITANAFAALVPVRLFVRARRWKRQSYVVETSPSLNSWRPSGLGFKRSCWASRSMLDGTRNRHVIGCCIVCV